MELHLQKRYFDLIKAGSKVIEGRLAKEKYRNLKIGDKIRFFHDEQNEIFKQIKALYIFQTFEDAFKKLDYKNAIPDVDTVKDAIDIYEQFYSVENQNKFGVIFIEIA